MLIKVLVFPPLSFHMSGFFKNKSDGKFQLPFLPPPPNIMPLAIMGEMRNAYILEGNLFRNVHLEDQEGDWSIKLR
jgi:hypothetical protein